MPKVVDLFAGVGGMSLGAAKAGFEVVAAVELDPIIIATHSKNFPTTQHLNQDVSKLTGKRLLESIGMAKGELDGLVGGPPCQGFSSMGKRDISDPRNELFLHFFRLVRQVEPKFFVAENVPGILHPKYSGILSDAKSSVARKYHILDPVVIHANEYGAATTRTRVFFMGYLKSHKLRLSNTDFAPPQGTVLTFVRDALEGLPLDIPYDPISGQTGGWKTIQPLRPGTYADRLSNTVPEGVGHPDSIRRYFEGREISGLIGTRHSDIVTQRYAELRPGAQDPVSKSFRLDLQGFCPTLRAGTGRDKGSFQAVRPIRPIRPRVISPREAARLQGFPDWFQFHNTKWHSFRQIGNSVSPIMSEAIFHVFSERLSKIQ